MSVRDDARDVGLLLRYALDHTATPSRFEVYGRLLDRYHSDPELRGAFDETITALGARVLAADRTVGLVLSVEPDSPLGVRDTSAWLRIRGVPDRLVYGLALGGAAAWCYPTARAVREPGTRRITAIDVDRLIREHADAIERGEAESDDALSDARREYIERRKQIELTATGQLKRDCTLKMCEEALALLASFGLIIEDRTVASPRSGIRVWRSTDRFRAHVAAGGGPLVWQTITESGIPEQLHNGRTAN